jgi:alpha-mannosidase
MGNRAESAPRLWPKSFDQRLRGSHLVEMALYPHTGSWSEAGVVQAARSWRAPLVAVETDRHTGRLPPSLNALAVEPSRVVVTAVLPGEEGLRLRMYESAGSTAAPRVSGGLFDLRGLAGLGGQEIAGLRPFQAAHATLRSGGASRR